MIKIKSVNFVNLENKNIEIKDVEIQSNTDSTIDGSNKYLMPGLVDMHTHITSASAKHYLYSGVTSVRNTGGNYEIIQMMDDAAPNVYATYRFIDGDPGLWGPTSYGNISTNDIDTAVKAVEELHQQGAKFIKTYGNIKEDVLKAVVKKSNELNLEVATDLLHSKSIDARMAADYGVKWLEHASSIVQNLFPGYHSQLSNEAFDKINQQSINQTELTELLTYLIKKDVKIVPTLTLYRHLSKGRLFNPSELIESKQMKLLDEDKIFTVNDQFNAIESQITAEFRKRQQWEYDQVKLVTAKYLELGGEVYIGTDAPAGTWVYPGLSMIEELNEFKDFGLDEYDILNKATIEAKTTVGEDDGFLLLNSNPIEDFKNILDIDTVFVGGKTFKHEEIAEYFVNGEKMMEAFEVIEKKYTVDKL